MIQRKIKKRKKANKVGQKKMGEVTHVSSIAPSYIDILNMWASIIIAILVPMASRLQTLVSHPFHHHPHDTY